MAAARSAGDGARSGSISHWTRTPLTSAWCREPTARARCWSAGSTPYSAWAQNARASSIPSATAVRLDRWSAGRVALIGDAGYAAGPGGNGTGTAVIAAYVLAGELAAARGDHQAAFARYERLLRPYVARGQRQARGGRDFLAPATVRQIRQRDRFFRLLSYLPAKRLVRYLSNRTATAIKLPEYPKPGPAPGSR